MQEFVFKIAGQDGTAKGIKVKADSYDKAHQTLLSKGYTILEEPAVSLEEIVPKPESEPEPEAEPIEPPPPMPAKSSTSARAKPADSARRGVAPRAASSAKKPSGAATQLKAARGSAKESGAPSSSPISVRSMIVWGGLGLLVLVLILIPKTDWNKVVRNAMEEVVAKVSKDPKVAKFAREVALGYEGEFAEKNVVKVGKNYSFVNLESFKEKLESKILSKKDVIGGKVDVQILTDGWWVRGAFDSNGEMTGYLASFRRDGQLLFRKFDKKSDPLSWSPDGTWEFMDNKLTLKMGSKTEVKPVFGFSGQALLLDEPDGSSSSWEHVVK